MMFLNTYMSCALARLLSIPRNTKSRVTRWCIGPDCYSESYPVITTSLTSGFLRTQDSHNALTIFKPPRSDPTIRHILCCLHFKLVIFLSDLIMYSSWRFVQLSHFKSERPTIQPFQPRIYALSYLSWFSMMPFIDIFSLIHSFLGCRPLLSRNVVSLHIQTAPFKLGNPPQFILPALLAHHISYSPLRQ
jgi:hypothetical protein